MWKKRIPWLLFLLIVSLLLAACQVGASGADAKLTDFLDALWKPAVIGLALSVILEKVPFVKKYFDKIKDPDWKRLAVMGFCMALPLFGLGLGTAIDYYEFNADTLFKALAIGWDAFATATLMHTFVRDKKK